MTSKDLKQSILGEIEKTGFPLELRVSKLLQDNDYHIANNLYYIDEDEGKGREVDIRALKNFELKGGEHSFFIRHCFLIECKKSIKDKPWVVFTSPITTYDKIFNVMHNRGFRKDDTRDRTNLIGDSISGVHPYSLPENRGRSFFEPFKQELGGESIYKSLTTVVKATIATRNSEFAAGSGSVCYYYPIIVFEGNLFQAYLHKSGIVLDESEHIFISFYYQSPKYKQESFIVPIIVEQHLLDFLVSMDKVLNLIGRLCKENMNWFES